MAVDALRCKRCGASDYAKSGTAQGHQRYCCRACGSHFTDTPLRGKPPAMKALAVLLYGMGGMGFSAIGRLLGVSDVAVLKWVRAEAASLPEPEVAAATATVEVDEMWHYLKKSLPSSGSAKLWVWRAYDVDQQRAVASVSFADIPPGDRHAMVLGGRDDETCRKLIDKVGLAGRTFVTDNWEGYRWVIPAGQLFTGKDLTFPIEQDNSNVRHYLARFRRRTKVLSKCRTMVDLSLRLLHHLQDPKTYAAYAEKVRNIFG